MLAEKAIPLLGEVFINKNKIDYSLIDISGTELQKGHDFYINMQENAAANTFEITVGILLRAKIQLTRDTLLILQK